MGGIGDDVSCGCRHLHRVDTVETGPAKVVGIDVGGSDETLQADIAQRISADGSADVLDLQTRGDELGTGGEVDAVEAGPFHRRGGG